MIKELFLFLAITLLSSQLFSQSQPIPPIPIRQVSGIVTDSTGHGLQGVMVVLTSKTDTLKTTTNEDGLFFFRNVKAWEFTLTVSSLVYRNYVKLGRYNDATPRLTMDPIILRTSPELLKEVTINGTSSIIYKTDTVEYNASDYIVREGSRVDELLKKMERMTVGNDGSLSYNGSKVEKARLNGKDFMGGSVSAVTKTLPADIVEKVQIVDDYGDQAARTGIKDGSPDKVLNITTKADRSVGYIAQIAGGAGNDARYGANLSGIRINGNRNYTLSGNINNTIGGVAEGAGFISRPDVNATGGTTKREGAGLTYRDQWSRKVQVNMNYSYNITNINSTNSSVSNDFSTRGTTISTNESSSYANSKIHNLSFDLEDNLDSVNYLKISPRLSYSTASGDNTLSSLLSGLISQHQTGINSNSSQTPNYSLTAFFQHQFLKKGRNYTIQLSGSDRNNEQNQDQNTNIVYYDNITIGILKDSLVHRLIGRYNRVKTYGASLTYSEPMGNLARLDLTAGASYKGYGNKTRTSNLNQFGIPAIVDSLGNIFNYSFSQARVALSYRYDGYKYSVSIGAAGIPSVLSGTNASLGTAVYHTGFNIVPVFRFQYVWSALQLVSINYSGAIIEPSFEQIQPLRDVSNPQNPVVGNPDLKVSYRHSISSYYSKYIPNTRFGIEGNLNATFYDNRVTTNIIQIGDAYNSFKYEKHFLNIDGTYRAGGNYTITKQLANRKYNFTLSGNIDHQHNAGLSNSLKNISSRWAFTEKIALRISSKNFQINPSFSYTYSTSANSLPTALDSKTNIISPSIDGWSYFLESWTVGYNVVKSFIHGINSNLANNPFIVNTYLEKEFFQKKSLKVRLEAFDLFNQNQFINRGITETSITDTRSNVLSRYFMFSIHVNLQRWQGTPARNGATMQRHNDGGFIYK